jgi:hypothetical protein
MSILRINEILSELESWVKAQVREDLRNTGDVLHEDICRDTATEFGLWQSEWSVSLNAYGDMFPMWLSVLCEYWIREVKEEEDFS